MQRRLLDARVRQLGSGHESTLTTRLNLAVTLEKLGKYGEAEREAGIALKANKEIFPEANHPRTLNLMNMLGLLLLRQGKYVKAEPLIRDALKEREKAYEKEGGGYHQVLIGKNNLAGLLFKLRRFPESAKLFREVLEGATKSLGEENPFTLRVMNSLSDVLRESTAKLKTGEEREEALRNAEKLQRTALAGRMKVCREDHPDTFTSMYNLAHLLQDSKRYDEAKPLYEQALEGLSRKCGPEHPTTLECKKNFEICLSQQ
jgi:tetratricopeptide (TPR) repeat protein